MQAIQDLDYNNDHIKSYGVSLISNIKPHKKLMPDTLTSAGYRREKLAGIREKINRKYAKTFEGLAR